MTTNSPSKKRKTESSTANADAKAKAPTPLKTQPEVTLSVCIPTTIISHCHNLEQKTQCIYQVARSLCLYGVSEVIVLDIPTIEEPVVVMPPGNTSTKTSGENKKKIFFEDNNTVQRSNSADGQGQSQKKDKENDMMLIASLLQFFITPPYLVKSSFNKTQLKHYFTQAYKLPKIPSLPFMLNNSATHYKEGLSIARKKTKNNFTKFVNVGEAKPVELTQDIPANVRVTVDIKNKKIVSAREAYGINGANSKFGYHVRIVTEFGKIFTESSYKSGYTKTVFVNGGEFFLNQVVESQQPPASLSKEISLDKTDKVLVIIGENRYLNQSFKADKTLASPATGLNHFKQMCDFELEIVRGCRIEDGLLIALTKLQDLQKKS